MSETVLRDHRLWLGSRALQATANSVALSIESDELDRTTLADTGRRRMGGLSDDTLGIVFTAGADPDPPATLRQRYPQTGKVICIIGPEGGLTAEEIELCRAHGFHDVGLGPRTLRTETASIVAAAVCQHLWGDLGRRPPARKYIP